MSRPLDLSLRFVLESPHQARARLDQRNLDQGWELFFLDHDNQLVVDVPLEQSLVLLRVALLLRAFDFACQLVNRVKWMIDKVKDVGDDSDRVFDTW